MSPMAKKDNLPPENLPPAKQIIPVEIEEQMKKSYLAYAMSVIVGRALPDVRDGLKPVHRRILHAMNERAWRSDRAYVKSAKIVGEVIGNYHPHGDSAVYDTMVRMAQDFAMRVPLIDGQGNFGSVDGDPPAAYRYTEARLTPMAEQLLAEIDKETVDFNPNFDNTRKEPQVLPAAFPNLLVNGSTGIAVGMATKIPPHNLAEVTSALELLIENPEAPLKDLMKRVPAPDFPTGGIIIGKENLKTAYSTGRGSIKIRAVLGIETIAKNKDAIVITEIPYEIKKNDLITKIAALVNDKVIEGISEIRDESDRTGMRIVLELRRDANPQVIINNLYKHSQLQVNYGIIFLALVKGEPRLLNLKEMLVYYLDHRKEVIVRRTQYELRKAEERAHILEGLKIALDFIDEVIKIIRGSQTVDQARSSLISRFGLSEIQANAILDMKLQKLTSLESKKIIEELEQLHHKILDLKDILSKESRVLAIISEDLGVIKSKYGKKRASVISTDDSDDQVLSDEDFISNKEEVVTLSDNGYVRRVPLDTFKRQHRGGKGVSSAGKKEDAIREVTFCRSHDYILFFTNKGKLFYTKAHEIPEASKDARGKSVKAILSLSGDEEVNVIRSIPEFSDEYFLLMLTRKGILKKTKLSEFVRAQKRGLLAINFKPGENDYLADILITDGKEDIILASAQGQALRTNQASMKSQGREASGIIGMDLEEDDYMVSLDVVRKNAPLLLVATALGAGKLVESKEFTAKGRGGKGMTCLKTSDKTGDVVSVRSLKGGEDLILISQSGMTVRVNSTDISVQSRTATGVKVVDIQEQDTLAGVAIIPGEKEG